VAGWFGRFLAESQSREDTYLVDPRLRGLSVKVRGGRCPGGEGVGVVLCYFPGRLARKFAYQALPIDGLYSGRHLVEAIKAPSAAAPKTS
jgi:hypothetical protein